LARSLLIDNNLELRFCESFKIPEVQPHDVVLVLGDKMKPVLEAAKAIPKNRTISSLRERVHSCQQLPKFMLTYHPSIRDVDHAKGVEVVCDFQLAKRVAMTGSMEPQLGEYSYPDDLAPFCTEVKALYNQSGKPVPVAFDLETLGVNQFDPSAYILNLSLSHTERTATALSFTLHTQPHPNSTTSLEGSIWWDLYWLLNTNKVSIRGANLKFDLIWVAVKWGIRCTNFKFDTLLVGSLLDENRSNSLKVHAKVYSDMGSYSDTFDHKYDKSRMDLIPEDERLLYAASDADATLRVAGVESELLQKSPMLTRFYVKLLHPAARAFEKVEQCGVFVDTTKYQQLQAEVENALDVYEQKALACVPRRLIAKWGEKASLTKAHFLADYMFSPTGLGLIPKKFTLKTNAPSTAMDHFEMFDNDERAKPFVEQLKAFNSAKKTLSTYVTGFLKHLQPDGRFHPTYFLANQGDTGGTVTGRLSAKDPAVQTLPKHTIWAKKIRKCFVAPPGYVMLGPDYSQGELKIAACLANEPTMIGAYSKGIDLHAVTASGIAGWELEEFMALKDSDPDKYDEVRQLGKAGNFGLCLAEGQLVLTNKGLVPIENVTKKHKLWDGLEWVSHEGLIFKGFKECITYDDVTATPDHDVWTIQGRKVSLREASSQKHRLAVTGEGVNPIRVRFPEFDAGNSTKGKWLLSYISYLFRMLTHNDPARLQFEEREDQRVQVPTKPEVSRPKVPYIRGALRFYRSKVQKRYACIFPSVQRAWYQLSLRVTGTVYSLGFGNIPAYGFQGPRLRQGRQRWGLLTRQSSPSHTIRKPEEQVSKKVAVYDILNAGPRHRFTCQGKLVSNCYGMGAKGFQAYAELSYGVSMTLEEAESARDKFFNTYPLLLEWHKVCRAHARKYKQIHSPLGRVRHLPLIHSPIREVAAKSERQCVNSPVQSTLSDMSLWATALMDKEYGMDVNGFCVIGMVHDQLLAYAPAHEAELWAGRMKDVMENLPFHELDWEPQLKFTVDMTIGHNLADLKKWSKPGDWQPEGV
jgi:DNA polymerase I-like protein with 3'-5' exonuclease and polymerase domains